MQTDPDIAVVMRSFSAYESGDIAQAVACMHPDVEWIEPDNFLNGGTRIGHTAMTHYFQESRALWAEVSSQPVPHRCGESVVVVVHVTGRLTDGRTVDATVADVFSVLDGLIVRMTAYANPDDAFAAAARHDT